MGSHFAALMLHIPELRRITRGKGWRDTYRYCRCFGFGFLVFFYLYLLLLFVWYWCYGVCSFFHTFIFVWFDSRAAQQMFTNPYSYIFNVWAISLTVQSIQGGRWFIRFISWNINGSQNPVKRKKCLSYLKSQQADVALIQETHLTESEINKFKRDWVGQLFHSSYSSKKCGVAILVHKILNFVMLKQHNDNEGRIICVEAKRKGIHLLLT